MRKIKVKSSDKYWSPVPNNPRDNELFVDTKERSKEQKFNDKNMIFGSTEKESRYGYRTVAGHWKKRDEPDDETQLKQADAINTMMQKRKAASGRERLKRKGVVPVRAASGRKLFEDFVRTARQHKIQQQMEPILDFDDMRNIYNSAQHLSYVKWIWFLNDEYGSRI
jgi:hypothetical protein